MSSIASAATSRRGSARASGAAATEPFSIEAYKLQQKIALAKKPRRRASATTPSSSSNSSITSNKNSSASVSSRITALSGAKQSRNRSNSSVSASALRSTSGTTVAARATPTYSKAQKQYLDWCVDKFVDPDVKLLNAIREGGFSLELDTFGDDELEAHMDFLQKHAAFRQICLSLGSVEIKRDLRNKFERLGIKRGVAFTALGAARVVKAVSAAVPQTSHLMHLEIVGVRIAPELAPLLSKAIASATQLEFVNFARTRLGDAGIEVVAVALGKCAHLQHLSLTSCHLTDKARDHIAKIITLHGVLKDEAVWSSSLRGESSSVAASRPSLLLDLSHNALGDAAAESISDALYNDKWLLGLNVSGNHITCSGVARLVDTLTTANRTLAVLLVNEMKEPGDLLSVRRLETLLHDRKALLQHVAFTARDKRLLLCRALLDWGVSRELVLEICQGSSDEKQYDSGHASRSRSRASNQDDNDDDNRIDRHLQGRHHQYRYESSDDDDDKDDNNQLEASTRHKHHRHQQYHSKATATRSPQPSSRKHQQTLHRTPDRSVLASEAHMAHLQTIKLLTERMNAMENEQRSARMYMNKLEAENQQLRNQLNASSGSGISTSEERIIARLEDTISALTQQVGELVVESVADREDNVDSADDHDVAYEHATQANEQQL